MNQYDNVPRVRIFPNGPKGNAVYLLFATVNEKEKYIKDEYRFCFDAERSHNSAMTTNTREKTKEALYAKRVDFAKSSGFIPKFNEKNIWVRGKSENEVA